MTPYDFQNGTSCPWCDCDCDPHSITVSISPVVEATTCSYMTYWQAALDQENEEDKIDPLVEWRAMMERETRPSKVPESRSGGIRSRMITIAVCRKRLFPQARAPPRARPAASGGFLDSRIR